MQLERLKRTLWIQESAKRKMYRCPTGFLTIGVGHNLEQMPISERAIKVILEDDIELIKMELTYSIKNNFSISLKDLSPVRQEILINMAFNMGVPRLLKFKKTFAFIKKSQFVKASVEMLDSAWWKELHRLDMLDGRDSTDRAEYLSYAMKHDKFMKGGY